MNAPQKPEGKKRVVTIYGIVALLIILAFLLCVAAPYRGAALTMAKKRATANEMTQVQAAVLGYYTEYSIYPVASDNATLVKMLDGSSAEGNTRQIAFVSFKPSNLDAKGELLDAWGTPIQLSVASDGTLRGRSAGPDKIFGTADDITIK